jgi:hypothetical protein
MTDTMIKVAIFLGDHGEKLLLRELIAEKEQEVKQAWAEVLAACLKRIRFRSTRALIYDDIRSELRDLIEEIEKLQPAASHLKELLREKEWKGRWAQHIRERHGDGEGREFFCDECKHLTELEKARAIEKKKI